MSSVQIQLKSSNPNSTISPGEVEKFEKMSSTWWDPNGPLNALHHLNQIRVPLIRDGLLQSQLANEPPTGQQKVAPESLKESGNSLKAFKILDVGCGGGFLTEALATAGASVLGIDPGKENIFAAQAHLPSLQNRAQVSYQCTTIEDFALANDGAEFDGIVMSELIEHVDNPEIMIQTAAKMTKIGGSIFLTTINRTFLAWAGAIVIWEYLLRKLPIGTHFYKMFIKPKELKALLIKHGYRVKLVRGMCYNPLSQNWYWSRSTSIHYAVHAIKET